jgi:hypothetical protein
MASGSTASAASGRSARAPVGPIRRMPRAVRPLNANEIDVSKAHVWTLRRTTQTEEEFDLEVRVFDNRKTSSSSVETFGITHRHRIMTRLDFERATSATLGARVTLLGVADVQAELVRELRRASGLDRESELTYSQSTEITIPARRRVIVEIHWKLIWQHGSCRIRTGAGLVNIPFSMTRQIRFDKKVRDK